MYITTWGHEKIESTFWDAIMESDKGKYKMFFYLLRERNESHEIIKGECNSRKPLPLYNAPPMTEIMTSSMCAEFKYSSDGGISNCNDIVFAKFSGSVEDFEFIYFELEDEEGNVVFGGHLKKRYYWNESMVFKHGHIVIKSINFKFTTT